MAKTWTARNDSTLEMMGLNSMLPLTRLPDDGEFTPPWHAHFDVTIGETMAALVRCNRDADNACVIAMFDDTPQDSIILYVEDMPTAKGMFDLFNWPAPTPYAMVARFSFDHNERPDYSPNMRHAEMAFCLAMFEAIDKHEGHMSLKFEPFPVGK